MVLQKVCSGRKLPTANELLEKMSESLSEDPDKRPLFSSRRLSA